MCGEVTILVTCPCEEVRRIEPCSEARREHHRLYDNNMLGTSGRHRLVSEIPILPCRRGQAKVLDYERTLAFYSCCTQYCCSQVVEKVKEERNAYLECVNRSGIREAFKREARRAVEQSILLHEHIHAACKIKRDGFQASGSWPKYCYGMESSGR